MIDNYYLNFYNLWMIKLNNYLWNIRNMTLLLPLKIFFIFWLNTVVQKTVLFTSKILTSYICWKINRLDTLHIALIFLTKKAFPEISDPTALNRIKSDKFWAVIPISWKQQINFSNKSKTLKMLLRQQLMLNTFSYKSNNHHLQIPLYTIQITPCKLNRILI